MSNVRAVLLLALVASSCVSHVAADIAVVARPGMISVLFSTRVQVLKNRAQPVGINGAGMGEFAMGFFLGLQGNNPQVTDCLSVAQGISGDVSDAMAKIKDAMHHPTHIEAAIAAAKKVVAEFAVVADKCDMKRIGSELKALASKDGFLAAAFRAISYLDDLKEDLKGAVENYHSAEFMTAGTYAGKAISLLIEDPAPADSIMARPVMPVVTLNKVDVVSFAQGFFGGLEGSSTDVSTCITNTDALSADISDAVAKVAAARSDIRQIVPAVTAVQKVMGDLSVVADSCKLGSISASLRELATAEGFEQAFLRIASNLSAFRAAVAGAIANFESKDYAAAGTAAGQATHFLLGDIKAPCMARANAADVKNLLTGVFLGLQIDNAEADKCVSDADALQNDMADAVAKIREMLKNPFAVLPALQALSKLVGDIQEIAARCQFAQLASDLAALTSPSGWYAAIRRAASHHADIEEEMKTMVSAFEGNDMLTAGVCLGKLLQTLIHDVKLNPVLPYDVHDVMQN
eukprot:GILK01000423.1.p1 GENE.GILK01000423.1~~GILK01000423.1.p1  ORF type:complete len:530 (-),score=122.59 GILK01000423.1:124-1680(-)